MIPFKLFGLQRTGTNLARLLLTRNFSLFYADEGTEWKHGPVTHPDRRCESELIRFGLCVKNPYAWMVSCYKYFARAYTFDRTVAPQFRANPTVDFEDFALGPTYDFATPVHRWNQMHRHWLDRLPEDRTVIIRQEDQLQDQSKVLAAVAERLNLVPRCIPYVIEPQHVDFDMRRSSLMNSAYYESRAYLREYPEELLEFINEHLDRLLMERFGYALETPIPHSQPKINIPREMIDLVRVNSRPATGLGSGKGIILLGEAGTRALNAWVSIRMLRNRGCTLPIEWWFLRPEKSTDALSELARPYDVRCRYISEIESGTSAAHGRMRFTCIEHSVFEHILLLEGDCIPFRDPTDLFATSAYQESGAIFWKGFTASVARCDSDNLLPIWDSGQMIIHKAKWGAALHGAATLLQQPNSSATSLSALRIAQEICNLHATTMPKPPELMPGALCQHDFDAHPLFFHHHAFSWRIRQNCRINHMPFFDECTEALETLVPYWREIAGVGIFSPARKSPHEREAAVQLVQHDWLYERVGYDQRPMSFAEDGTVSAGRANMEIYWDILSIDDELYLDLQSEKELTCRLHFTPQGTWEGQWERFEKMPIRVAPLDIQDAPTLEHEQIQLSMRGQLEQLVFIVLEQETDLSFVQIGRHAGNEFLKPQRWRGVIVEPSTEGFSQIRSRWKSQPHLTLLHGTVLPWPDVTADLPIELQTCSDSVSEDPTSDNQFLRPGAGAILCDLRHATRYSVKELLTHIKQPLHIVAIDAGAADIRIVRSLFQNSCRPRLIYWTGEGNKAHTEEIEDFLMNLVGYRRILRRESRQMWLSGPN